MSVATLQRRSARHAAAVGRGGGSEADGEAMPVRPDGGIRAVPGLLAGGSPLRRAADARDPLGGSAVDGGIDDALRRRRGAGESLPRDLAGSLGAHFGQDLGNVRVHADGESGGIARALQSTAFTHGSDLYFAPGAYRPASEQGQRLIAHEVSHVLAQRSGADRATGGPLTVGRADDPAEAAADRSADGAMAALRRSVMSREAPAGERDAAPDADGAMAALRRSVMSREAPAGERDAAPDADGVEQDRLAPLRRSGVAVLRRDDDPPVQTRPRGINLGGGAGPLGRARRGDRRRQGINLGDGRDIGPLVGGVRDEDEQEQDAPRRERGGRIERGDGLALFKQYLQSADHRTLLDNIPSSKLGRFDAEYDPEAGILAITVRPRFTFTGAWEDGEKTKFITEFQQQVAAKWSGRHDFACTKPGMESLRARVEVQVEPAGKDDRAHFEVKVQDKKSGDTFIGREQFSDPSQIGSGTFSQPDAPERPHDNMGTRCSLARHDAARIGMFIRANMTVDARGRGVVEFDKNAMKPADAAALDKLVKVLKQTTELGATPLPIIVTMHEKGMFDNGKKRAETVRAVLAANGHYPVRVESAKDQLATLKAAQKQSHKDYALDDTKGNKPGGYFDQKAQTEIDQHADVLKSTNVTIHPDEKWAASYKESDPYSILAHEFGHMLGNPDEYFGYGQQLFDLKKDQLLGTGREGDRQIAEAMKVNPETIGERAEAQGGWGELVLRSGQKLPLMTNKGSEVTNSMMNAGTIVMPAHYATIWEALGRITSKAIPGITEKDWVFGG